MIIYYDLLINAIENIEYIILEVKKNSKYSEMDNYNNIHLLEKKINKNLKGKNMLKIKINSHPCSGKSKFIRKYKKKYPLFNFYDFDNFEGKYRTSQIFVKFFSFLSFFLKKKKILN